MKPSHDAVNTFVGCDLSVPVVLIVYKKSANVNAICIKPPYHVNETLEIDICITYGSIFD